ncbi:hypothetical protein [Gellertiella hungarica]|uniref:Myb-like domain-containing protein n=1 Tax=Gellertiella hungarica TaxID=1572859 RepID=A0A7W6NK13_9HYPH|nr:hypothetical protein [Gellertiella hungarica]MBB4064074.1 hypothetical protein [Gellertiella hungarica]
MQTMVAGHRRWTAEEDQLIRDQLAAGKKTTEIWLPHRSSSSIQTRACRLKLTDKQHPRKSSSYHPNPRAWSQSELALLVAGIAAGVPVRDIEIAGRSHRSLETMASRLGVRTASNTTTVKTRPCITCRRPIRSEHAGHRMCDRCRHTSEQYACI